MNKVLRLVYLYVTYTLVVCPSVHGIDSTCLRQDADGTRLYAYTVQGKPILNDAEKADIIKGHNVTYNAIFATNAVVVPLTDSDFSPCAFTGDEVALATTTLPSPFQSKVDLVNLLTNKVEMKRLYVEWTTQLANVQASQTAAAANSKISGKISFLTEISELQSKLSLLQKVLSTLP